jgi:hypothetical protein
MQLNGYNTIAQKHEHQRLETSKPTLSGGHLLPWTCDHCGKTETLSITFRGRDRNEVEPPVGYSYRCTMTCVEALVKKEKMTRQEALKTIRSACRDTSACRLAPHVLLASGLGATQ